jgi:NAD(P)-dependent dehydrogenase (short-subunit alcohol dehydrogenase family)
VVSEVISQRGRVDILVSNAGITIDRTVAKMPDEDWMRVLAVNQVAGQGGHLPAEPRAAACR